MSYVPHVRKYQEHSAYLETRVKIEQCVWELSTSHGRNLDNILPFLFTFIDSITDEGPCSVWHILTYHIEHWVLRQSRYLMHRSQLSSIQGFKQFNVFSVRLCKYLRNSCYITGGLCFTVQIILLIVTIRAIGSIFGPHSTCLPNFIWLRVPLLRSTKPC